MKTIDLKNLPTNQIYRLLTSSVAPRPIALVSTISETGIPNLAPYSYFNAFSSNPPIVGFSVSLDLTTKAEKHTLLNAHNTGEVVINMVNYDIARQMTISSINYPIDTNEFEKAGFTSISSEIVKPLRIKESPVQMECKVQQIVPFGEEGGAGNLIICQVLKMHIDEAILDDKGNIHPHKIDLVGRMGKAYYVRASGEAIHTIYQPLHHIAIGFEQLPESAKSSSFLTGNELAQLASLTQIPNEKEILALEQKEATKALIASGNVLEKLHLRAKSLLASEQKIEAAHLVWLAEKLK